jgi:hypothetical protein
MLCGTGHSVSPKAEQRALGIRCAPTGDATGACADRLLDPDPSWTEIRQV